MKRMVKLVVLVVLLAGCEGSDRQEQRVRHPELAQVEEQARRSIENALGQWRLALDAAREPSAQAAAYAQLGQVYLAHHFDQAAADALARATTLAPDQAHWLFYYATALARTFQPNDAESALTRALALSDDREIRFSRARVRHRLGNDAGALSDLAQLNAAAQLPAEEQTDAMPLPSAKPEAAWLALEAEILVNAGRYEDAAERLSAAMLLEPEATALMAPAARVQSLLGNARQARRLVSKAGTVLPQPEQPLIDGLRSLARGSAFYLERGRAWMKARRFQQAVSDFAAAADIAPSDHSARLAYARALEIVGQDQAAEEQFVAALELEPESAITHYFLGTLYERQQKDTRSLEHYRKAIESDSEYLPPRISLAHMLFRQQAYAEALTHYTFYAERRDNDLESRYYAGLAALSMGNCASAPDWFEQAATVNSYSLDAQEAMARSFAVCSTDPAELSRAQDIGERLEQSRPDASAAATLAMVHAALNDFDVARRYQKLAIRRSDESTHSAQEDRLRQYESSERSRTAWLKGDPVFVPPRLTRRVSQ